MSNLSRYFVAVLLMLSAGPAVACAELWNPFSRQSDRMLEPYARPEKPEESRWFLLPPLRWSERAESDGPSLWQQWQASTHRTFVQTRERITAPWEAAVEKTSEMSLWPRWRGTGEEKSATPPGWFAESPPRPTRPSTVNDFLALPRPQY